MLAPLALLALLAPATLGIVPHAAAEVDPDPSNLCATTTTGDKYCVRTIPVDRLAYIAKVNGTQALLTIDVERWFVSLEQNIQPISPAPGVIVVTGTVNGEPDPEDLEVSVGVGPYRLWTDAVFQKRLCGTEPCAVVYEPVIGTIGELWLSILEISENDQPLVRAPITTVRLYSVPINDLADVGNPDFEDFTS